MCGLSFYCSTLDVPKHELQQSLNKMLHRGPDGNGIYHTRINNYFLGLGHNRLKIIDLSDAGKQPMDVGIGITISFNGEIYNYKELRSLLEKKGIKFKSTTDTEVIIYLYAEYGVAAFSMLRGMYAFALIDARENKFILVRDTIGIKPLYIYKDEQGIYGSSEIRGLRAYTSVKADIDSDNIYEFFNTGFLYEPDTGFTYIKKLMPGYYLEINLSTGHTETACFQSIQDSYSKIELSKKIESAISQQELADVPVGAFFSGGVDSSIIAYYIKNNLCTRQIFIPPFHVMHNQVEAA